VGKGAVYTAFHAVFGILKIAAALLPQGIEGAVAEQAVEILLRNASVTGEIFTFFILEELVVFHSSSTDLSWLRAAKNLLFCHAAGQDPSLCSG
jgi:hypothetical protein